MAHMGLDGIVKGVQHAMARSIMEVEGVCVTLGYPTQRPQAKALLKLDLIHPASGTFRFESHR